MPKGEATPALVQRFVDDINRQSANEGRGVVATVVGPVEGATGQNVPYWLNIVDEQRGRADPWMLSIQTTTIDNKCDPKVENWDEAPWRVRIETGAPPGETRAWFPWIEAEARRILTVGCDPNVDAYVFAESWPARFVKDTSRRYFPADLEKCKVGGRSGPVPKFESSKREDSDGFSALLVPRELVLDGVQWQRERWDPTRQRIVDWDVNDLVDLSPDNCDCMTGPHESRCATNLLKEVDAGPLTRFDKSLTSHDVIRLVGCVPRPDSDSIEANTVRIDSSRVVIGATGEKRVACLLSGVSCGPGTHLAAALDQPKPPVKPRSAPAEQPTIWSTADSLDD